MAVDERLRVDIAAAAARGLELKRHTTTTASGFVQQSTPTVASPSLHLRLYPAVLATLRAVIGSVEQQGVREAQIVDEAVTFHGSDTARTEHLVSSGLTVRTVGTAFDVNGNAVDVSITADAAGQLKASQPFWGAAIVSYTTRYRLLEYHYRVSATGDQITGGIVRITGGTVLAFHDGEAASFEPPLPETTDEEPDTAEVYRDVSYIIVQAGEAYERPPNWPDATWSGGEPDPDDGWMEVERVHAIGRMESLCRLAVDREFITAAKPKKDLANYTIPLERIVASDESLVQRGYSSACVARAKQQIPEALG